MAVSRWSGETRQARFLRLSAACAGALFLVLLFVAILFGGPVSSNGTTWWHAAANAVLYNFQYVIVLFIYTILAAIVVFVQRPKVPGEFESI
jgi:uncharacterized membrane protein YozB (DUF420 family)